MTAPTLPTSKLHILVSYVCSVTAKAWHSISLALVLQEMFWFYSRVSKHFSHMRIMRTHRSNLMLFFYAGVVYADYIRIYDLF